MHAIAAKTPRMNSESLIANVLLTSAETREPPYFIFSTLRDEAARRIAVNIAKLTRRSVVVVVPRKPAAPTLAHLTDAPSLRRWPRPLPFDA